MGMLRACCPLAYSLPRSSTAAVQTWGPYSVASASNRDTDRHSYGAPSMDRRELDLSPLDMTVASGLTAQPHHMRMRACACMCTYAGMFLMSLSL